eukprot:GHUV01016453.1.p1 GENE.GHUV01016453.1~~GHUV01016453.1.p1  ORF type:complete len:210 (-),score=60.00 GHUV01016453.1:66-695(-)
MWALVVCMLSHRHQHAALGFNTVCHHCRTLLLKVTLTCRGNLTCLMFLQRGLYKQPDDPHGEHLVIKAANTRHGNAASRHQNRHISPHSEQQPGSSSSQQQSEQHRQARPAGRLDPPEDSNAAYGDSNGLVKVPEQGSLGEGASRRVGGRNRANRRSKDTIPGTDPATAAIGNASGAGGLPITPKVVLNRRGAAAGGTAAPWLQTQTAE